MRKGIVWVVVCIMVAAVVLVGLVACGSKSSSDPSPAATTYSISGTVTASSTALQGATMTLSGPSAATATTDASGNYTFTALANGSYTITPSKSGYTFDPTNSPQTVNSVNITGINFIAAATGVTGTWSVTNVASNGSGSFTMYLIQIGSSVTGTVTIASYNGNLSGSINGSTISLSIPDPQPACSGSVATWTGTVNGNTMSGSGSSTAGGSCAAETDTWTATRQ
jgi:hypothetical protein